MTASAPFPHYGNRKQQTVPAGTRAPSNSVTPSPTTYTYDAWARLKQATNAQWTVAETYDRYGNRKSQSAPVANNVTINAATNRIADPGYSYDAAGNMTADGLNTMTYNGESRVATNTQAGATTTYTYDRNGLRVKKQVGAGTPTVYIFSGSKVIAEYDNGAAPSSPSREYIYSGGALLAKIEGGATSYFHQDHLSIRMMTDSSGNVLGQRGHYPFGETWYESGTTTKIKFTTYERDSESGNDYAIARYYVNRFGRFLSTDPIAGSLGDPQSLNRYTYSRNLPIILTDPSGMSSSGCLYIKNSEAPTSSEKTGGPGPSDNDASFPEPQNGCAPSQPGGGVFLDGGDIGDYSGSGMGFPVGGGGLGGLLYSFSGSPNFHWSDYDISELLDFAAQGEITLVGIFQGDDPGSLFGLVGFGPGGGGGDPVGGALKKLKDLLKDDAACVAFLNSEGEDALQRLDTILRYGLYGQAVILPTKNADGSWTITNAVSFGYPNQLITVNKFGAFNGASVGNFSLTTDRGRIRGGTQPAQLFILLHELGHNTGALQPDAHKQKLVDANDKTLEKKCKRTIKSFSR